MASDPATELLDEFFLQSPPPSCPDATCSTWTITAEGSITTAHGVEQLSSADLATIDGILRDPAFRQATVTAENDHRGMLYDCATGVSSASSSDSSHVVAAVFRDGAGAAGSVETCIGAGAPANPLATIYAILQMY